MITESFLPTAQTLDVTTVRITREALRMETTTTALGLQGKSTLQISTEDPKTSSMIEGLRMAMGMESLIEEVLRGKSLSEDPLPGKSLNIDLLGKSLNIDLLLLGKSLSEDPLLGRSLNIDLLPGKSLIIDLLLWKSLSEEPLLLKSTLLPKSTLLLLLLDMYNLIPRCMYTITLRTPGLMTEDHPLRWNQSRISTVMSPPLPWRELPPLESLGRTVMGLLSFLPRLRPRPRPYPCPLYHHLLW